MFFGTPSFAVPSLLATAAQTDLVAVVTQPDRPRGRGQKVLPCEVKEEALKLGVKTFSPVSLRKDSPELSELRAALQNISCDLFVVTAYGNLLPKEFLEMPHLGCINVHASLLPKWRGAAPIQRSVEAGDKETGVCLQKMVMELDAGDVLTEARFPLDENIASHELFEKLSSLGGELLAKYLSELDDRPLVGAPQDSTQVTFAKKISKEEGNWSPEWTAVETHNRLRAFTPWPGVRAKLDDGSEIKIIKTSLESFHLNNLAPGELQIHMNKVVLGSTVRASDHGRALVLESIQVPGKAAVKALDYFRNYLHRGAGQKLPRLLKTEQ